MLSRILILTEAGSKIGFGHLTRCSAIKNYLEDNSFKVDLIVNNKGGLIPNLDCENIDSLETAKA